MPVKGTRFALREGVGGSIILGAMMRADDQQLLEAAARGDVATVSLLIKNGAHVNVKGEMCITPLIMATVCGKLDVAKVLLKYGASVDSVADRGVTPLMVAAWRDDLAFVNFLLDNGADINVRDMDGDTALIYSMRQGSLKAAKLLIKRGANVRIRNKKGMTALMLADKRGYAEVATLMRARRRSCLTCFVVNLICLGIAGIIVICLYASSSFTSSECKELTSGIVVPFLLIVMLAVTCVLIPIPKFLTTPLIPGNFGSATYTMSDALGIFLGKHPLRGKSGKVIREYINEREREKKKELRQAQKREAKYRREMEKAAREREKRYNYFCKYCGYSLSLHRRYELLPWKDSPCPNSPTKHHVWLRDK